MHFVADQLVASATDLANFLACRRKTALSLAVARGGIQKPSFTDPVLEILRQRGQEHEQRYVAAEAARGFEIADLSHVDRPDRIAATLDAMRHGAARIVQAALVSADGRWSGYADVLRRVETPSPHLGAWSYEALDTKLAQETKGATVLQLSLYSDMLGELQGLTPEFFHVVTPLAEERYRVTDYAAYYRWVKQSLQDNVQDRRLPYPEPVAHCAICDWSTACTQRLRADDHLSFVAHSSRLQRQELATVGITTLEILGKEGLPAAFRPSRGSAATYARLQHQARLQLAARETKKPGFETLPVEAGAGLCLLPAPSPGDVFLDLEGAAFARPSTAPGESGGREYLIGFVTVRPGGEPVYDYFKAFDDAQERAAFEAVIDRLIDRFDHDPGMHVYHYAPYEPAAFKRLMGRYATRGRELDRLLRGKRFVDLYAVVRHAIRAGIESYSIKELERFYGYRRAVDLKVAGANRRVVEYALDTGSPHLVNPAEFDVVIGYNRDDCVSTLMLRDWLERLRAGLVDAGTPVDRPLVVAGDPSEELDEREKAVEALRARLLAGVPPSPPDRSPDEQARYLLAYLLDWHRRESKAEWWEYFRLRELPEDELLDESKAVAGLQFVADVERVKRSTVQRFSYPEQELEIRPGLTLKTQREEKATFAKVIAIDRGARTIDLLVGPSKVDLKPTALFAHKQVHAGVIEDALFTLAERVAAGDPLLACPEGALLLRRTPALLSSAFDPPDPHQGDSVVTDYAVSIAAELNRTALAIQGPPGTGKTFTGARMICALVDAGFKVGVTAGSHKVIRNLLDAVQAQSTTGRAAGTVRLGHKTGDDDDAVEDTNGVRRFGENPEALAALQSGEVNVLGGTAWLWARPEFAGAVDVLFVDEAGQMSLANALGVARAAKSLVLLGDPRQLDQPTKGTHPDGVGVSALQHMLGEAQTMPRERGLFLPVTWRLAPSICAFTSELFYAGQVEPKPGLERQALAGNGRFESASSPGSALKGLWFVLVDHRGNRNASDEEADEVVRIVRGLLASGSMWIDQHGDEHQMTPDDIRIVAPFNSHVQRIREKLLAAGSELQIPPVGTVDKFQGQEAPVVIYSMASSRPEDAPRGMEFLYSLNRLNVATSRAQCAVIVVLSPALFEPACATPRQMQLANALGRYREMAGSRVHLVPK